jgi:ribosomal protein L28
VGYRDDDVALQSHCEALEQELVELRARLTHSEREARELRSELTRRRWRLRLRAVWAWAGRHKLFVTLLVAAIALPTYCGIRDYAREAARQAAQEEQLARLGCRARLKVVSDPSGAVVFSDSLRLGETPLESRICPGSHLVRVVHDRTIPWQRAVVAPKAGHVTLEAPLIALRPHERPPGVLLFSEPDGAFVFVDGQEVGRTPLLLTSTMAKALTTMTRGRTADVALWAEGRSVILVRPRPNTAMWFALPPAPGEAPHGRD